MIACSPSLTTRLALVSTAVCVVTRQSALTHPRLARLPPTTRASHLRPAAILKFTDNIVRVFAHAAAMLTTMTLEVTLFGASPTPQVRASFVTPLSPEASAPPSLASIARPDAAVRRLRSFRRRVRPTFLQWHLHFPPHLTPRNGRKRRASRAAFLWPAADARPPPPSSRFAAADDLGNGRLEFRLPLQPHHADAHSAWLTGGRGHGGAVTWRDCGRRQSQSAAGGCHTKHGSWLDW